MKQKVLSLFLACVMLVAVLSACSSNAEVDLPEESSAPPATEEPEESAEPELPEYAEITVEIFDRGTDGGRTDPTNNYYTDWIKEKVLAEENIGVTFVAVSRWEETQQLNNLMASRTAPDICMTYSTDLISNYRDLGGLVNVAPYIDTLLPDLKEFLGEDPCVPGRNLIYRDLVPGTDAVFSMPARRINMARINTFIRKDWLDELGLPLPTTTEEYHQALLKFKEGVAGLEPKQVVPFTMSEDVRWQADNLLYSFLDPDISDRDLYVYTVIDRKYLLPGYKEGVRFMNQMYHEGLIDPDFPLYPDDPPVENVIKSGVVGSFMHNWDQAFRADRMILEDLRANVPTAEIVAIDPFKNAAGVTAKQIYDPAGLRFCIPTTCKNVEAALRYINWLSKFENYNFLQIGEEGVTHELVDGVPKIIQTEGPQIMNSSMNIDYTMMINGLNLGDDELNVKATALAYPVDPQYIIDAYNFAMANGRPDPVIPLPLSAAGPVTQTLDDLGDALMAEAITCDPEDFDAVWDAGIENWLAAGAQAVIDERAMAYDMYTSQN